MVVISSRQSFSHGNELDIQFVCLFLLYWCLCIFVSHPTLLAMLLILQDFLSFANGLYLNAPLNRCSIVIYHKKGNVFFFNLPSCSPDKMTEGRQCMC